MLLIPFISDHLVLDYCSYGLNVTITEHHKCLHLYRGWQIIRHCINGRAAFLLCDVNEMQRTSTYAFYHKPLLA